MPDEQQKLITVHAGQILHDTERKPYQVTTIEAQGRYPVFYSPVKRVPWIKLGKKWYQV